MRAATLGGARPQQHDLATPTDRQREGHADIGTMARASGEGAAALQLEAAAVLQLVVTDASRSWRAAAQPVLKRTLDITVSLMILLLVLPVMAVVALAIVIESPGPIFYRAERVGRSGRLMRMFKFRKMAPDAGGLKLTMGDDRRLTRVGAFLTRSKLDELPQLVNVLRGEMSLIGPRPEDPSFVEQRRADYDEILRVRPGITGLSQIAFADESRILSSEDPVGHYLHGIFPQKCALDRLYARSAGFRSDVVIFAWTLIAVLLRREVAVHRGTGSMSLRRRPVREPVVAQRGAAPSDAHPRPHNPLLDPPRLREHGVDSLDEIAMHAPVAIRRRRHLRRRDRR